LLFSLAYLRFMKRNTFLRLSALAAAGPFISPLWFYGCKKEGLLPDIDYTGRVLVIGAGISGLYAAQLAKSKGAQVKILEASSRWGGRIRPLTGFSDFTVELGAEEVHGQKSMYFEWISEAGTSFVTADSRDFLFKGSVLRDVETLSGDAGFQTVESAYTEVDEGNYGGPDQSVLSYLQSLGVSAEYMPYGNALLANEYGTSAERISVFGASLGNSMWNAGDSNFFLKNADHAGFIEVKFADVLPLVAFQTPVTGINYQNNEIVVTDSLGNTHLCDKLIITVPLGVLKAGLIQFTPSLSTAKSEAIQKIGFGNGMKIILRFTQRFWPDDTGSIYGSGPVPEYWATGLGRSAEGKVLTAFVMGEKAEVLHTQGASAINTVLADLDSMFDGNASAFYDSHVIMDWTNEPFVLGSYSFPALGEGNARAVLASPVNKKLYFAGEACHTEGHFATMHGAVETALYAVRCLLEESVE
jgi:monoamine oxidase